MIKIALRNLMENKIRSFLTSIGVILSVALVLGVGILNESMVTSFENMLLQVSGKSDITVTSYNGFSEKQKGLISGMEEIQNISYTYIYSTKLGILNGETEPLIVNGIDLEQDKKMKNYSLLEGTYFQDDNTLTRQALIGVSSAKKLGLSINDSINIETESGVISYKIVGILDKKGAGISVSGVNIYVPIKSLQNDTSMPGHINSIDIDIGDDEKLINIVADKLEKDLGQGIGITNMSSNLEINKKSMESIRYGFNVILIGILFVSCFLIYNTFIVIVYERMKIIGILRTLGMNRRQAVRMVLVEGIAIGIVGTLIGLVLGLFIGMGLIAIIDLSSNGEKTVYCLSASSFIYASIVGIVMSIISAYIPARISKKISPIAALKPNDSSIQDMSKKKSKGYLKTIIGFVFILANLVLINLPDDLVSGEAAYMVMPIVVILLFIGITNIIPFIVELISKFLTPLLMFLFGMEGKLAGRNLLRNKNRTSVVISVIVIGIMVSIGFNGLFHSFRNSAAQFVDENFKYDLNINGNFSSISDMDSKIHEISKIENVDECTTVRIEEFRDADSNFNGKLFGIDPEVYSKVGSFDMIEGDKEVAFKRMSSEKDVGVIGQYIAQNYGIKVGDYYSFVLGDQTIKIEVVGIINSYTMSGRVVYVNKSIIERALGDTSIDEMFVKTSVNADVEKIISEIKKLFPKDGISILTISEVKQEWKDNILKGTEMFDAINYIVVFSVLLGLANTLIMGVYERKREIGMLRSIGANPKQIKKMVFLESIVIIAVSIVMGIIGGLFFTNLTTAGMAEASGFKINVFYPIQFIILISVMVFVCAVMAAVYPANIASNANVVESIKSE